MRPKKKKVEAIRLVDPYVIQIVTDEQRRSNEATSAKTAARLIVERIASGAAYQSRDLQPSENPATSTAKQ